MYRYIREATDYILAMSKSRVDLEAWIEDQTLPTMIALAQLYVFPYGARTHWRREVWEKFHIMHLFRHNKKLPDAQFILKSGWNVNNSNSKLENVIDFVISKEEAYQPRNDIDLNQFRNICEAYFKWLANELSQRDLLAPKKVYEELDRLGLTEHA